MSGSLTFQDIAVQQHERNEKTTVDKIGAEMKCLKSFARRAPAMSHSLTGRAGNQTVRLIV